MQSSLRARFALLLIAQMYVDFNWVVKGTTGMESSTFHNLDGGGDAALSRR